MTGGEPTGRSILQHLWTVCAKCALRQLHQVRGVWWAPSHSRFSAVVVGGRFLEYNSRVIRPDDQHSFVVVVVVGVLVVAVAVGLVVAVVVVEVVGVGVVLGRTPTCATERRTACRFTQPAAAGFLLSSFSADFRFTDQQGGPGTRPQL
jgi:hypothetical protein